MPLEFNAIGDLLERLEALVTRNPPLLPIPLKSRIDKITCDWFGRHRETIDADDTDLAALLSTLLPARRTDRVYYLQPTRLCALLGRCFRLGHSRLQDLERWRVDGCGTLADCVERIQRQAPNQLPQSNPVTVEQVDAALNRIASQCCHSAPRVRATYSDSFKSTEEELGLLYSRLSPRDCKWLTCLILKDYAPVCLDEGLIIQRTHPLLYATLKIRATFESATAALREAGLRRVPQDTSLYDRHLLDGMLQALQPLTGTFVGRPQYFYGRNLKYLVYAARGRKMCLERKYDGESCQIHVDLRKKGHEIQIFSKTGKDSTADRQGVHRSLKEAFRIGKSQCSFSETAIFEGELLAWCDISRSILPFHKIRNHVRRSGRLVGTWRDTRPPSSEHLMVMLYDVLQLDETAFIHQSYKIRRAALLKAVDRIPGHIDVVGSETVDFGSYGAAVKLLERLSHAFAHRWEGYVMKPLHEPYINISSNYSSFHACWFKIKKDYIPGLGDTVDMLAVAASYDAATAARIQMPNLSWTHLHIACVNDKVQSRAGRIAPKYRVFHVTNEGLDAGELSKLCVDLSFRSISATHDSELLGNIDLSYGNYSRRWEPLVIFEEPLVVELTGYGFEIPANDTDYALRFARIVKIKWDADPSEAHTLQQIQDIARLSTLAPAEDLLSDEVKRYRRLLEKSEVKPGQEPWWEDGNLNESRPDVEGDGFSILSDAETIPPHQDIRDRQVQGIQSPREHRILGSIPNPPGHIVQPLHLVENAAVGEKGHITSAGRVTAGSKRARAETHRCEESSLVTTIKMKRQRLNRDAVTDIYLPPLNDSIQRYNKASESRHDENSSSDCEAPLHPSLDTGSYLKGLAISPPRPRKQTSSLSA